jgi:hypothetical protein
MACPPDFEPDVNNTCRMKCPRGFKYLQASGGETDKCVYETNNLYSVDIQSIPVTASQPALTEERNRFYNLLYETQSKILEDIEARRTFSLENNLPGYQSEYRAFQTKYAGYNSMKQNETLLEQTMQDLKPLRRETAPGSDMEVERKKIITISNKYVLVAQVALLTTLVCLVIYFVAPVPLAHGIVFLVVCVGIAIGIFLMSNK